jgi:hypothetical protein
MEYQHDNPDICITIGRSHVYFTIEPIKSRKEGQKERLRLIFGTARDRANANKFWEDDVKSPLEDQLTAATELMSRM